MKTITENVYLKNPSYLVISGPNFVFSIHVDAKEFFLGQRGESIKYWAKKEMNFENNLFNDPSVKFIIKKTELDYYFVTIGSPMNEITFALEDDFELEYRDEKIEFIEECRYGQG